MRRDAPARDHLRAAENEQWLRRNGFPEASKHTVDRLMREEGMNGLVRGPQDPHYHPGQGRSPRRRPAEPGLHRPGPNQIWVTDFTYVPVYSGFVYVALVIDLYSRSIVGWETSTIKDTAFVEHCLRMALWRREHTGRPVPAGLIHHSDYAEKSVKPRMVSLPLWFGARWPVPRLNVSA